MKRLVLTIFLFACAATPLIAQDIDLGLGGDASSLLNIAAPRGNQPARGNAPNRGASPSTAAVDRLVRLRELLAQSNLPLSPEQQTSLAALLNAEIPAMRQSLQKRVQAAASPPTMEELTPEIVRL